MNSSSRRVTGLRAGALWLAVTAVLGLLVQPGRTALETASGATRASAFADLLVAGCALAAVLAAGWLWVVTTGVVLDVLRTGPEVRRTAGPVRALLLAACGVAVLTAGAHPAHAGPAAPTADVTHAEPDAPPVGLGHDDPLEGLPLPDRASGSGPRTGPEVDERPDPRERLRAVHRGSGTPVRVRPGDSLWAIAEAELGPTATAARVAAYWPQIHHRNYAVVGDDPDLVLPGQRLLLPPP